MPARPLVILGAVVVFALGILYLAGLGLFSPVQHAGTPEASAVPADVVAARGAAVRAAAAEIGVAQPKQILFGDLHVHSTFSFDAFQMSLPMAGGDGAHPIADACDFARYCSGLDFWSINDHAITLTPRRWSETVDAIRQCNAVAGEGENPDLVSYLGWEWTQVGSTPKNHWGHKNVIVRDLEDGSIPTRPISAGIPADRPSLEETAPSAFLVGLLAIFRYGDGGSDLARYLFETTGVPECPEDVPERDLPTDCREMAPEPRDLFAKLDDWGFATLVIPHGTTWGFYTPLGSSWDKQLTPEQHDPQRQRIVEVFSGHGNSEEFRPFREVILHPDGSRSCPEPDGTYLSGCWRAGEIIEARCLAEGGSEEECARRAETARQNFVDAPFNGGGATVKGTTVRDWQDAGQCRDCFQPAFNYRPRSSVQYMMALGREDAGQDPLRFRFGFIASSDNHSGRPGTGYKEVARTEFTEQRFGNFLNTPVGEVPESEPLAESVPYEPDPGDSIFAAFETERQASFFLTGGLAAVHSTGRDRQSVWDALQRREVYGTSGPRILLWFDLLNPPGGRPAPMGSEVSLERAPIFQVRAVGSLEQAPGCPGPAEAAMSSDRIARLCRGECYNPTDERRPITRIEVVRIRTQESSDEDVSGLVEDPWRTFACPMDPTGCQAAFTDEDFVRAGRDTLYYVRAIEAPSLAVAANPLGCRRDATGRCVDVDPCWGRPDSDDCLAPTEERAWSSPIFVGVAH
jgi:hypothetical protein